MYNKNNTLYVCSLFSCFIGYIFERFVLNTRFRSKLIIVLILILVFNINTDVTCIIKSYDISLVALMDKKGNG